VFALTPEAGLRVYTAAALKAGREDFAIYSTLGATLTVVLAKYVDVCTGSVHRREGEYTLASADARMLFARTHSYLLLAGTIRDGFAHARSTEPEHEWLVIGPSDLETLNVGSQVLFLFDAPCSEEPADHLER
jgi:hypothetical protein